MFCHPLDLSKLCEGSPKSHFSRFRKMSQNEPPKASILEAFWAPKSAKSRSGRVPEKHQKKYASNDRSGSQKGPQKGWFYCRQWGTFFKIAPGGLPGASRVPFLTLFGNFFEGFSILFYTLLPFASLPSQAAGSVNSLPKNWR